MEIEFLLTGEDANGIKLRAMVEGIANQVGDKLIEMRERRVFVVRTDNPECGAILKMIAQNAVTKPAGAKPVDTKPAAAKRGRKKKESGQIPPPTYSLTKGGSQTEEEEA